MVAWQDAKRDGKLVERKGERVATEESEEREKRNRIKLEVISY